METLNLGELAELRGAVLRHAAAWLSDLRCVQEAAALLCPARACHPMALRISAQQAPASCRCPQRAKRLLAPGLGQS